MIRKFLAILCILFLLPGYAFAKESPTLLTATVSVTPELNFCRAEEVIEWPTILKYLERLEIYTKGYTMLEAVFVNYNVEQDELIWKLPIEIKSEHEPFVFVIDASTIIQYELQVLEDGSVVMDMTPFKLGFYYICFYIKEGI